MWYVLWESNTTSLSADRAKLKTVPKLSQSVNCYPANFCIHASKGPVIIRNQLKSNYNRAFKDSHSHNIHACFPIIASSELKFILEIVLTCCSNCRTFLRCGRCTWRVSRRVRVTSTSYELARIRYNWQELGTKTANFVLILFLF